MRAGGSFVGAVLLVSVVSLANTARADDADDRRVRAGARLFRSLLAADTTLETKAAQDGSLEVVVYGDDDRLAPEIGELIATNGEAGKSGIHDYPVHIVSAKSTDTLAGMTHPAGIFLVAAQTPGELAKLIRWSQAEHIVLYSPFEGDVERGAAAGISVEAKVRPYLNTAALQAAGVEIKPFYVKVAKVYP